MKKNIEWRRIINWIVFAIIMIVTAIIIYFVWPTIESLNTVEGRDDFRNTVSSFGVFGFLILFLLQVLQVVVAVIPGQAIEILGGMMYGVWGGTAICIVGVAISTVIIYGIFYFFGRNAETHFLSQSTIDKFAFMDDSRRLGIIFFSLFLVPGIPKDILIYVAPTTKIKFKEFMFWSLLGRIPSTIVMCYIGASLASGEQKIALIVGIVSVAIAILGIVFNKKIAAWLDRRFDKEKEGNVI